MGCHRGHTSRGQSAIADSKDQSPTYVIVRLSGRQAERALADGVSHMTSTSGLAVLVLLGCLVSHRLSILPIVA